MHFPDDTFGCIPLAVYCQVRTCYMGIVLCLRFLQITHPHGKPKAAARRGPTGFPEASEIELWGFSIAVEGLKTEVQSCGEESPFSNRLQVKNFASGILIRHTR